MNYVMKLFNSSLNFYNATKLPSSLTLHLKVRLTLIHYITMDDIHSLTCDMLCLCYDIHYVVLHVMFW